MVDFFFKDNRDNQCEKIIEIGAWRLHADDLVKLMKFLSEYCVLKNKSEIDNSEEYSDEESCYQYRSDEESSYHDYPSE